MATATEASQQANRSGMDPKRLVVIFYLIAGIVLMLFLAHVFDRFEWANRELFEGGFNRSGLIGFVLASALGIFAYRHPKTHDYSLEVANELMKVTWPTWQETRVSTTAVIIASLLAAVILFFIDTIAYKLMVDWIPAVWGNL